MDIMNGKYVMPNKFTKEDLQKAINDKLRYHECNEQWGCYNCYYRVNKPCIDYQIIKLAKAMLEASF